MELQIYEIIVFSKNVAMKGLFFLCFSLYINCGIAENVKDPVTIETLKTYISNFISYGHEKIFFDLILKPDNPVVSIRNNKSEENHNAETTEITPLKYEMGVLKFQNILIFIILSLLIIAISYIYHFLRLKKELSKVHSLEKKLIKREDEYERIFNSMQDVYYRSDINGNVVSVSPSVFMLSGFKVQDVIGQHESFFYEDSSHREPLLRELISKGEVNDSFVLLKNAWGKTLPISLNARVIYDENNTITGFEGVLRDVSKTVANENLLKASEQKLKIATEIAKLGISVFNQDTEELEINEILSLFIFGDSKTGKISFSQLSNLIHPEDYQNIVAGFNKLLDDEAGDFDSEFRIAGFDGEFIWFNSKFVKVYNANVSDKGKILGIHLYINELKKTLLTLQHNQRKLEAIYNSVQIMLIVADKNLNIREVNDVVTAETGLLKEKLIGNSICCLCEEFANDSGKQQDISSEVFKAIIRESVVNMENIYNKEISFPLVGKPHESGKSFYSLSTTVFTVENELRILLSIIDITDRKTYEVESERTRMLLEENSKLKSDFISNLSYEIRTPINSIVGFVSLLKSKSVSNEQKEKYVEIIRDSSDKLLGIIENVVELSKAEFNELDVRKTEFNIVTLIKNIEEVYSDRIKEKGLNFYTEINIPSDKVLFDSDLNKIRTVLGHLIENSIKYTDAGRIDIGTYYGTDCLWFYVSDTGSGIEEPDTLFETSSAANTDMFDMNDKDRGMGISLRICKAYIEVLGGELLVVSEPGAGSRFSFYIPAGNLESEAGVLNEKAGVKAKILIVEDEDYNYDYLSQILEMEGYDYLIADDGQKAIDIVKENQDIDLILMDIRLPGIDGLEASRIIKSMNPEIPIIAQTAYGLDSKEDKQMEEYCDDYIQKPIVSKILINKIEKFLK